MIYRIIFLSGARKGQRVSLEKKPVLIGRDPSCEIRIPDDEEVAGKHAEITHQADDTLLISDLGTMYHLLVNNQEVTKAVLKHGDLIEIGRTRFLVQAFVQAEVKGTAAVKPVKKKSHLGLTLWSLVCIFAIGISIWMYNRDRNEEEPLPPEAGPLIPPDIFKDLPAINVETNLSGPVTVPEIPPSSPVDPAPVTDPEPEKKTGPASGNGSALAKPQADKPASKPPPEPTPPPEEPRPPVIIASIEQQRFPESSELDEMRVITITLARTKAQSAIDPSQYELRVLFFDQDSESQEILPSRSVGPVKPIQPSLLASEKTETLTAAYTVPKGLRNSTVDARPNSAYYGVVARLYFNNKLIHEDARPKTLLMEATGRASDEKNP